MSQPAVRMVVAVVVLLATAWKEDVHHMKVILRQSGGYAALLGSKTCELDTAAMEETAAETLRSLVRQSRLQDMRQTVWKASEGADLINYELLIETEEGLRQFSFDEMSVPESAIPLWEHLLERCH